MKRSQIVLLSCAVLGMSRAGATHDRWESVPGCSDDVFPSTSVADNCNQLLHGKSQLHDLEGAAGEDVDHMLIWTNWYRSYEVRTFSSNQRWSPDGSPGLTHLSRLDRQGNLLQAGVRPGVPASTNHAPWSSMRWIEQLGGHQYVRVQATTAQPSTANDQYEIEFLETTVYVPRWNNSGSQVTVLFVQMMMEEQQLTFDGSAFFIEGSTGNVLHTENIAIFGHPVVINTANIPALAGKSGSLMIAHTGGWGALNVKAVAMEPATGFSFDTVGSTRPR